MYDHKVTGARAGVKPHNTTQQSVFPTMQVKGDSNQLSVVASILVSFWQAFCKIPEEEIKNMNKLMFRLERVTALHDS